MIRLFLPQSVLEEWALGDRADVRESALSIPGEPGSYPVAEAYHIQQLVSGPDEHKLLNKVKTQTQLEQLKAEVMSTSLLAGESAYEAVQGYTVEVRADLLSAEMKADLQAAAGAGKNASETDLLAAFLLDKL